MTDPNRKRRNATLAILALAIVGSMVHQAGPAFDVHGSRIDFAEWRLWKWYIEDAGICFAYARNWVEGAGLVAFPGGERIEGFSDPTWIGLLSVWQWFGVDGFVSSKIMGMVLGGVTILLTWRIAVEVIDDEDSWAPLIAPILLACYPQFVIWNASGLENPLVNVLLAAAIWRAVVEAKRGGFAWSALWWMLLAISRPETIMYAAWGGFASMVVAIRNGDGLRRTAQWLVTFFVPFGAFEIVRYEYFAWPFANTYYAKLGEKPYAPFAWEKGEGWKYVHGWAWDTGTGWFTPVALSGLIGLRGKRRWVVPAITLLTLFLVIYPSLDMTSSLSWWPKKLPDPAWWNTVRVWALLGIALAAMVAAFPDRRAFGRVLSWGCVLITIFFAVRAGGDWMKGYRWMSFVSVPGVVLLTTGIDECAGLFQRTLGRSELPGWTRPGWVVAIALTIGILPGWFVHSAWFIGVRETGPYSVKKRVDYTEFLMNRTWTIDRLVHNLDVDMGAHLYWSKHQMVDLAGLVDVPIAHHGYKDRSFVEEYIFNEEKPLVAHVHGGWATRSKIPTFPEWKRDYIGVPPFPMSPSQAHVGTFIRRDLLMSPTYTGVPGRELTFDRGIVLTGFDVPSPELSPGKSIYIEVSARYVQLQDKENFRILMFLADHAGHIESWDVPVGYDWLPPVEWQPGEVWTGRFSFALDKDLPAGTYDVGFVVVGADGVVVPLANMPPLKHRPTARMPLPVGVTVGGDPGVPARMARGEVVFPGVVTIGDANASETAARADLDRASQAASSGQCDDAAAAWRVARLAVPNATTWIDDKRASYATAEAKCYAALATRAAVNDPADSVAPLESARVWTWDEPALWAAETAVGKALYDRGLTARAAKKWPDAYVAFDGAVRADRSLAWARRYAEEARDERLGIADDDAPPVPVPGAVRPRAAIPTTTPGAPPAPSAAPGATATPAPHVLPPSVWTRPAAPKR